MKTSQVYQHKLIQLHAFLLLQRLCTKKKNNNKIQLLGLQIQLYDLFISSRSILFVVFPERTEPFFCMILSYVPSQHLQHKKPRTTDQTYEKFKDFSQKPRASKHCLETQRLEKSYLSKQIWNQQNKYHSAFCGNKKTKLLQNSFTEPQ